MQSTKPALGIWIREDRHGQGFGCEAVGAVRAWGSEQFSPTAFIYPVAEPNVASRRIAEALGGEIVEYGEMPKYRKVVYEIPPIPRTIAQSR